MYMECAGVMQCTVEGHKLLDHRNAQTPDLLFGTSYWHCAVRCYRCVIPYQLCHLSYRISSVINKT